MSSYDKVRISKEWMFFCISPLPFKGIGKDQNHKDQSEMCLLTVANDRSSSDRELKISPRILSWSLVGAQALVKAREAPALTPWATNIELYCVKLQQLHYKLWRITFSFWGNLHSWQKIYESHDKLQPWQVMLHFTECDRNLYHHQNECRLNFHKASQRPFNSCPAKKELF